MSDFSTYAEEAIVDWMVGGTDMPAASSSIYIALHTGDPTDDGTDNEVTAASYSRVETTAGTDWTITGDTFENASDEEFPEAQEDWGNISHFTLWDGPSDTDNSIANSALDSARGINTGDVPVFRAGGLTGSVN